MVEFVLLPSFHAGVQLYCDANSRYKLAIEPERELKRKRETDRERQSEILVKRERDRLRETE